MMKHISTTFIGVLLLAASVALSGTVYAQEEPQNAAGAAETKEMNCCEKMDMMKDQMKTMMENHKIIRNEMKTLFTELQQSGKLTQAQINKMKNIEKMMDMMEEKMKQMSSMKSDVLK